jgi:hypothetical protein
METLPPESLPKCDGATILVCSGNGCDGDAPCAWCIIIDPDSDLDDQILAAWCYAN